jgi:hypothetical protein
MIKIAIDINDTLRAFTKQYALQYQKSCFNVFFDINNLVYENEDIYSPFKFKTQKDRENFQFIDYVFEIYGAAKCVDKNLHGEFNIWKNDIEYAGKEDEIEISIIAGDENELSIQATLFFLSKICTRVRNIEFPKSSEEIWKKYDIVITADNRILKNIPPEKTAIKIKTEYNKNIMFSDEVQNVNGITFLTYDSLLEFLEDKETHVEILKLEKDSYLNN